MKYKLTWNDDGSRNKSNDNGRPWVPGQFWAGDAIDELPVVTRQDWQRARVAQVVVDVFLMNVITIR